MILQREGKFIKALDHNDLFKHISNNNAYVHEVELPKIKLLLQSHGIHMIIVLDEVKEKEDVVSTIGLDFKESNN